MPLARMRKTRARAATRVLAGVLLATAAIFAASSPSVAVADVCSGGGSAYASAVVGTSGLVGYWRLGESSGSVACDSAGGPAGSFAGGVVLGEPGAVVDDVNSAARFDGVSGRVDVPATSALDVGDRFSVEAWVRRGLLGGKNNQVVAAKQDGSWVLMFSPTDQLVLRRSNVGTVATSTVTVSDTTRWHHVAATKDGAAVHLFVDGVDVTGAVTNRVMANNTLALSIGQSSSSAYLKGALDEVALYRVALSPAQIAQRYRMGSAQRPSATAPPTISGQAQTGQTLTASLGSWQGSEPISYDRQWRRCDTAGDNCADIAGATSPTYTLTSADLGATIRARITATDSIGSSSATSAQTATIVDAPAQPDPSIAAVGDMACDPTASGFNSGLGVGDECRQAATSDLVVGQGYRAVLPLGDLQYECGGYAAFQQAYDPSWGRVKSTSHPIPGNHEYQTTGGTDCDATGQAAGYYRYFDAAAGDPTKGYYSYDIGSWHLIALNSNCGAIGGCGAGSAQDTWLRADLAAHPAACTLAYWHHPRFTSGDVGNSPSTGNFWNALSDAGADVVLNGHAHDYERFAPQTPAQTVDRLHGIRQFVVGTGGEDFHASGTQQVNSEVLRSDTFGVLELTLHPGRYDWRFVPALGATFTDSGSDTCH